MTKLQQQLFAMQDKEYKEFHQKLMPTVSTDAVIGIRIPQLRKFAKEFARTEEAKDFLKELPHQYYEENNLHAFVIEQLRDYETTMRETEIFLPYIDNWATCDCFSPKVFKKHPKEVLEKIKVWIKSEKVYTVRYGIGLLMANYLEEYFQPEMLSMVAEIRTEEYYINMMCAWYMATALAKQYDAAIPYITEYRLTPWVQNKSIQKAVESRRIDEETKEFLKKWKRKE